MQLNYCDFFVLNSVHIYGSGSSSTLCTYDCTACSLWATTIWNASGFVPVISTVVVRNYSFILDNSTGIYAVYNSNINANETWFCGSINYDLWASSNAYIFASDGYYNNQTPRIREDNGGNVEVSGAYNCSYLAKNIGNDKKNNNQVQPSLNLESVDPVTVDFRETNRMFRDLCERVEEDVSATGTSNKEKFRNDYLEIINNFKAFIDKNPNSGLAKTALATAVHCFKRLEEYETMSDFLKGIMEDERLLSVNGLAKRFTIDYYRHQKDFDKAVLTADEIMEVYAEDKDLLCDVLFKKGLILLYDLNKPEEAAEFFSVIVNNYSDNPLTEFAKNELEILGIEAGKNQKVIASTVNLEFKISNFPNPFNPITIINYALPVDVRVVIKVYDILGRELAELVNEEKPAGTYSVNFDASNLASGIYFYSISAGKFNQVSKMILLR